MRDAPARTDVGAVMGTPGFMAPEQISGDPDTLGPWTDIYSLGAILFEVLTLEPLHPRGSSDEMLKSTTSGVELRAALRAPDKDIPPELEAIYTRATAALPSARFASAREMYEAIEAFQSGDRDVVRRKQLAALHATEAASAAQRAVDHGDAAERARAMREVTRAVSLDPENVDALKTLVHLLTAVPPELPREAKRELASAHRASQRASSWSVAFGYLSWLLYAPLVVWMGLREGAWGVLCDVLFVGAAGASLVAARYPRHTRRATDVVLALSTLGIACSAGLFGPFMLLPGLAAVNAVHFVVSADRSRRVPSIFLGCVAIVLPFLLQWFGVLPQQMTFTDAGIVLAPGIAALPPGPTLIFLLLSNLGIVVTASLVVARFRDATAKNDERLYFQTWQLRQIFPGEAMRAVTPGTTTGSKSRKKG